MTSPVKCGKTATLITFISGNSSFNNSTIYEPIIIISLNKKVNLIYFLLPKPDPVPPARL